VGTTLLRSCKNGNCQFGLAEFRNGYRNSIRIITEAFHYPNRIQVFINRCLRRVFRVFWPNVLSNEDLWSRTNEEPVTVRINRTKWRRIGHKLRMKQDAVEKRALCWNLQGQRKRGTKNEFAEKRGGRGEERRKDLERAESLSKEQNPLALLRRGPMLWKRAIGSNEWN
jgi:hypothetical protein